MRDLVVKALSTTYLVHAAHDATDAKALLARMPAPNLIICDVMMPKIDGFAFVAEIRKDKKFDRIPVIFLTAKSTPIDVLKGINAGARHYVTKPFKLPDLLAKVEKIFGAV